MRQNRLWKLRALMTAGVAVVLLPVITGSPSAAATEQWLAIEADPENLAFAVDLASIQRQGERVTFRERVVFANPDQRDAISGKLIKEKHALRVMRCKARMQGVKTGWLYDENQHMIERVSVDEHLIQWRPIPPGSVGEREFDLVCDPKAVAAAAAATSATSKPR
jgi:hypothetical protein